MMEQYIIYLLHRDYWWEYESGAGHFYPSSSPMIQFISLGHFSGCPWRLLIECRKINNYRGSRWSYLSTEEIDLIFWQATKVGQISSLQWGLSSCEAGLQSYSSCSTSRLHSGDAFQEYQLRGMSCFLDYLILADVQLQLLGTGNSALLFSHFLLCSIASNPCILRISTYLKLKSSVRGLPWGHSG